MKNRTPTAANDAISTRERILLVAHALIREQGNAAITLVDVAARAGVSRQTMYLLFGSRAGLLVALVEHLDQTSGGPQALAAVRETLPPDRAFEPYLRAWFDYLPEVFTVARALSAAAASGDTDAALAWESRMNRLRAGFKTMTQQLSAHDLLADGWSPATAADWLFAQTHIDLWQHLVVEAGWRPAVVVDHVVGVLKATLIRR